MEQKEALLNGSGLLDAEHVRLGLVLAAISSPRQHVLIVGRRGQAKTEAGLEFMGALGVEDNDLFLCAGYRGAGEEILVGYPSVQAMRENRYELMPGKSILSGPRWVIIDEIDKINRATQQALLQIMQSKRWSRAGFDVDLSHLELIIGLGNAVPEDEAVRDRFGVQIPVEVTGETRRKLIGMDYKPQERGSIKPEFLAELREKAKDKKLSKEAKEAMGELVDEFDMSPRRVRQNFTPLVRAAGALLGHAIAGLEAVAMALPYVALHSGDLSMNRFQGLKQKFEEAKQKARLKKAQDDCIQTLSEAVTLMQNVECSDITQVVAVLRKVGEVTSNLPDPDTLPNPGKVRAYMENVATYRRAVLSRLGII